MTLVALGDSLQRPSKSVCTAIPTVHKRFAAVLQSQQNRVTRLSRITFSRLKYSKRSKLDTLQELKLMTNPSDLRFPEHCISEVASMTYIKQKYGV